MQQLVNDVTQPSRHVFQPDIFVADNGVPSETQSPSNQKQSPLKQVSTNKKPIIRRKPNTGGHQFSTKKHRHARRSIAQRQKSISAPPPCSPTSAQSRGRGTAGNYGIFATGTLSAAPYLCSDISRVANTWCAFVTSVLARARATPKRPGLFFQELSCVCVCVRVESKGLQEKVTAHHTGQDRTVSVPIHRYKKHNIGEIGKQERLFWLGTHIRALALNFTPSALISSYVERLNCPTGMC